MSKPERAVQEAEKLREKLGDDLVHYTHKYPALREEIEVGLRQLDAGEEIAAEEIFARLRSRYGL